MFMRAGMLWPDLSIDRATDRDAWQHIFIGVIRIIPSIVNQNFPRSKNLTSTKFTKKLRQHVYSIKWVHCQLLNLIKLINIVDVDGLLKT